MSLLNELFVKISGNSTGGKTAVKGVSSELSKMNNWLTITNASMKKMGPTMEITAARIKKATNKMNKEVRTSRFHTANLAAQFNDIGVMMGSGQSPMTLALQQGTQITQVLNTLGGTPMDKLKALGGALKSAVNFTSLLTIGVIAGAAALYQWATAAGEAEAKTKQLADAIKSIGERALTSKTELDALLAGYDDVEIFLATRELARIQAQILAVQKQLNAEGQVSLRQGGNQKHVLEGQLAALQKAAQSQRENLETLTETTKQGKDLKFVLDKLPDALQKAREDAKKFADELHRGELSAIKIEALAGGAIRNAEAYARTIGAGRGGDPRAFGGKAEDWQNTAGGQLAGLVTSPPEGGKGGSAKIDPLKSDLEKLQEKLATEIELENKAFNARQKVLEESLAKRLITQQTHDEMMKRLKEQHERTMADLDVWRYGSTLDKTGAFFGEMAQLTQSGNDKMFRIAKAAGAAQALISAWQGAAEALKGSWPQNVLAFAQVLSAGLGAVNAIKGINSNGTGPTSAGGSGVGATLPAPEETARGPAVSMTLIGDNFSRSQVVQMAEAINDAGAEGSELIAVRGRR